MCNRTCVGVTRGKMARAHALRTHVLEVISHTHVCDRTSHVCVCAHTFATHPLIIIVSFYYLPRKFMCIKNWKARFKTLLMLAWVKKCFPCLLNSILLSYCKMICMYQTINNVPIKLQNFGFQSQFSMSKIICIFLFFFTEEYKFCYWQFLKN